MSEVRIPSELLREAAELLERAVTDSQQELPAEDLQRLLAAAVRLFVAGIERGGRVAPFPSAGNGEPPTATEVMVATTEFLAALDLELFELGMWQTWGGVRVGDASKGASNGS